MTRRAGFALLLGLTHLSGCMSWSVSEPGPPIASSHPPRIADRVLLQVEDAGVAWSRGRMGEVTRQTLIELGCFREVYYPDTPRRAPPLLISMEAVGRIDEHRSAVIGKTIAIVLLAFLPVGVVTFDTDFTLEATAILSKNGRVLREVDLITTARTSVTLFHDRETAEAALGEAMFQHLAAQLAVRLTPVSSSLGPPSAVRN